MSLDPFNDAFLHTRGYEDCSAHHLCVDLVWAVTHVIRSARRLYCTVQYEVGRLYYLVL
jgi:hypothetical protein